MKTSHKPTTPLLSETKTFQQPSLETITFSLQNFQKNHLSKISFEYPSN